MIETFKNEHRVLSHLYDGEIRTLIYGDALTAIYTVVAELFL